MKKILLSVSVLMMLNANGQIDDQVTVLSGYTNQSYYSLENGEESNITNQDWDLAFDVSPFGSSIRTNGAIGVELYVTPFSMSDWATIDTTGMLAWTKTMDSDRYWNIGAFNADFDSNNSSDLGWGEYSSITHYVVGNKTFVVKFTDDSVKKIVIEQLGSGTYTFKYSDLDNTNEVQETIVKSGYAGKNFVYYNMASSIIIDKEPLTENWDMVFGKYITEIYPGATYGVTGVLLNIGVTAYKDASVETNMATIDNNVTFNDQINTIGYNWKSFNMSTYTYDLNDSATYFVQTVVGDVWKLGFTEFGGSSTGVIEFTKEKVAAAGIYTNSDVTISTYPNPVSSELHIESGIKGKATIELHSNNGQLVIQEGIEFTDAPLLFDVRNFKSGLYLLIIKYNSGEVVSEKIIINI